MEMNIFDRKWMVLFIAFFGNFCAIGLLANMSVLYVEWLETFEQSAAETALVQSISIGIFSISGVIFGTLLSKFGIRIIGMLSGILLALGFILSFFAPNLIYLIIIISITAGLGSSGIYLASLTAVQQYFHGKQRQVSLSIATLGAGVAGTVFPYLLNYLSLEYGWKGCMLIVGGIILHCVPLFAICRPINQQKSIKTNTQIHKRKDGEKDGRNMNQLTNLLRDFKDIFRTKLFIINLLGQIIVPAVTAPMIIMIDYLQEKGFSREDAVLSYLVLMICGTISRLAPALLKCIPRMSIFGIALLTSALATATFIALPSVHSFSWNMVVMCCIGFCHGAVFGGILPITVSKSVSKQHFSQALGITLTGTGIELVLIGPFHGYLRDITGSYDAAFYASGSYGCLSILMYVMALGFNRKPNQLKTTNSDDRKQPEEENTSTHHAYENLSFETHL